MSEITIPNWTMFGTHVVSIEIHKFLAETPFYQCGLTFCLDDSQEINEDATDGKWITIFTDLAANSAEECAYHALHLVEPLFGSVLCDNCLVLDEEGNEVKNINLTFLKETFDQFHATHHAEEYQEETDHDEDYQ